LYKYNFSGQLTGVSIKYTGAADWVSIIGLLPANQTQVWDNAAFAKDGHPDRGNDLPFIILEAEGASAAPGVMFQFGNGINSDGKIYADVTGFAPGYYTLGTNTVYITDAKFAGTTSVTAVPEPSTIAGLLGMGLVGAFVTWRRRK
jgi:hypothetical protein